jgi:hypothetical protein
MYFNTAAMGTTGIASPPTFAFIGSTGDPIYLQVLEDNSISFEGSQGQLFSISPNLTTGYIWAVNDISGVPLLRSSVGGTIGIAEFGGVVGIGQTNPTYKLDLKGSFGLASSNDSLYNFIFSNSAASGSNSFQVRSANSILFYNSGNTFYTGFKSTASANKLYVLPATDGSNGQFLQTDGNQNLTWATATGGGGGSGSTGVNPGGQYQIGYYASTGASIDGSSTFTNNTSTGVIAIGHATVSTNFSNGALTVSGGVGIGGSLNVGGIGASIVGVNISNSTITRGTWNGTVISTVYGGTGLNLTGTSGVLTVSSGTVSASTTSSAISSAISDKTGSGALTFATSPDFTTSVTTGSGTFAVFNTNATTINAFGAATTLSIGASTGKATFNSTDNSTTVNTGGLVSSGGAGIAKSLSVGGYLQLFNSSNFTSFVSAATANTVYTLPPTSPATGSSVLQSTSTGVMSWVPMVASGGAGSGTVAIPDAQFRLAFYAGTGASVSSTNLITAVGTGVTILGATNASSTTVAALSVLGGLGVTGNAFIGGTTVVTNTTVSTSTGSGALVIAGGVGIGGSLYTATGSSSSVSGVVLANNTVSASTYNKLTITAPTTSSTLTIVDGSSLITSGANSLTLTTTATTNATFPSGSKTLVATDVTSLASLNTIGVITSGTWSASAITSFYGGTGHVGYTNGDLLVGSGNTLAKLPAGASNLVLTSNGTGTVPSWQSVPPSAASSVAVTPTVLNQSFFVTAVNSSNGSGLGLSTIVSFVVNPSTNIVTVSGLAVTAPTQSTSSSTGALNVTAGASVGQTLSVGGSLNIFNGSNYSGFRFTGTANTTYILPTSSPAIGTSVLQSTSTGEMSWVPMVASGGAGSGTVAIPDAQFRLAYYAGTGASVSSTNLITAVGTGVTILGATNASSARIAALSVLGGLGVTGNAFIGGTTVIDNSTVSIGTNSGALVVTGGVGIGGTLFTSAGSTSSVSGVLLQNGNVSASTYNKLTLTAPATSATLTLANGSTLVTSGANSLTLTTTAASNVTFPTAGTLITSGATSPDFLTSITTSSGTFAVFNTNATTINAFGVATAISIGAATGKATFNSTDDSSSTTTGSLAVSGGAGFAKSVSIGGRLQMFNGANYTAFVSSATGNITYTLPPTAPSGTGSSYLSASTTGVMAWVAAPTAGGGSPGGSNKQIQFNNSSAFGGAAGFEFTTGGIANTVSIFSASGTGYTAGLWVHAINGTTTRVGIGLSNPAFELEILGEISATNKSFVIDHPTKSGMKLRYGSLEGPENGVYVRGELKGTCIIEVPDHWIGLVHEDSYTVHLTPIGRFSQLYVEKIENYNVFVADTMMCPIHCYYSVWAERKDIPKLVTEYEAH